MKNFIILIILLNLNFCLAQNFEGIVKYKLTVKPKTDEHSVEFYANELGTRATVYFYKGYYKEITEGAKFMSYQLYRKDENNIYFKHHIEDDTLRFTKATAKVDEKFEYQIVKNADTILGKVCDKLILTDRYGTKQYFYSPEYKIDPKNYENYTYAHKNELMKLMQAIYLKLIMEYQPFIVELTATEIKRKKLQKKDFKLPNHKYLKAE